MKQSKVFRRGDPLDDTFSNEGCTKTSASNQPVKAAETL